MDPKRPPHVLLDGRIVPYQEATIHVMTPCVRYGALVFEGIRAYWNEEHQQLYLFRVSDHSKRLLQSAALSRMNHDLTEDACSQANLTLLQHLGYREDLHIRQMLFVDGDGPLSSRDPTRMACVGIPRGRKVRADQGLRVSISSWTRIDDSMMPPRIKAAANYQNGRLALVQAQLDGYDSTILLNNRGKVAEGPGACIFMVKDAQVVTPTVTSAILESITRKTLIQISREHFACCVVERDIDRTELYTADELFFCGTGAEITPIVEVDHYSISRRCIGEYTQTVRNAYIEIARGFHSRHKDWLTPVYKGGSP